MPEKIVRCLLIPNLDGVLAYFAEDGRDTSELRFIYPDETGELWYWAGPRTTEENA